MSEQLQKEKKKVFTFHIKQNIENEDWQKLIKVLPGAEDAGVSNQLLLKSYMLLGEHFIDKEPYSDAITYFSKASLVAKDEPTYLKLVATLKLFYDYFESSFSKSDIQYLVSSLRHLYLRSSSLFPTNLVMLNEIKSIISAAQILEQTTAEEVIESSATFKVVQVCNSLYRPKTSQDVFERSAEVMMDSFQELYDEELKKELDSKKKKRKKKITKKKGDKK